MNTGFFRTKSGLKNTKFFLNADVVVFLEGGTSLSKEQIKDGDFNQNTCDIRYWARIFDLYAPKKSYRFKSMGSKSTLIQLAEKCKGTGNLVVMDSDYQPLFGDTFPYKHVIYSFGYSWENDLLEQVNLLDVLKVRAGANSQQINNVKDEFEQHYNNFINQIYRVVKLDISAIVVGNSIIDREQYNKYILRRNTPPEFNKKSMIASIRNAKKELPRPFKTIELSLTSKKGNCFGHLIYDFCRVLLSFYNTSFTGESTVRKRDFSSLLVSSIDTSINPALSSYYSSIFRRFN